MLLGDPVTATIDVLVDRRAVGLASVKASTDFTPFKVVGQNTSTLSNIGHAARLRFTYRLICVTAGCIDAMEQEIKGGTRRAVPIRFGDATVSGRTAAGGQVTVVQRWPTLAMHSRLTFEDIALDTPEAGAFRPPPISYRVGPGVLGGVALGVAIALLLIATFLVARILWNVRRVYSLRIPGHLTPIDRALALARHAAEVDDVPGGRKALERLADALDDEGKTALARAAERIAWSSAAPSTEAVERLAESLDRAPDVR